jgi:hypothetical protein
MRGNNIPCKKTNTGGQVTFPMLTVMAKSEQGKYNKGLVILPMLAVVFWSHQEKS